MTTGGVGKTPVVLEITRYLLKKGEKVVILGPSGSGKSTFAKIVSNFYPVISADEKTEAAYKNAKEKLKKVKWI